MKPFNERYTSIFTVGMVLGYSGFSVSGFVPILDSSNRIPPFLRCRQSLSKSTHNFKHYDRFRNSNRIHMQDNENEDSFFDNNDELDEMLIGEHTSEDIFFEYPVFEGDEDDSWYIGEESPSDGFNLDELHDRISGVMEGPESLNNNESMDLIQFVLMDEENNSKKSRRNLRPQDVYIILFNLNTEDEGVHTIQVPADSGRNFILAFECRTDCENFASKLQGQEFQDPSSDVMNLEALEEYCATSETEIYVKLVSRGTNLEPPKVNVEELDYNPEVSRQKAALEVMFQSNESMLLESGVGDSSGVFISGDAWE